MARRMQPAPMTFFIPPTATAVPAGGGRTSFYIDLSQVASLVNRRFYRQGLRWSVAGMKINTQIANGSIEINKLPETWVFENSYTKGFRRWQEMINDASEETDGFKPKFLDFKIFADKEHHSKGFAANLLPSAGNPSITSIYSPGEWESSKIVVPFGPASAGNTAEFEITGTDASFGVVSPVSGFNSVSLIEGYAASRGLPQREESPTPLDGDDTDGSTPENWMVAIDNEGTTQTRDVILDMQTENNKAPYPFEGDGVFTDTQYPGGANQAPGLMLHDAVYPTNTAQTVVDTYYIKGGSFPCGLIKINATNNGDSQSALTILIDMVPGTNRGYDAHSMLD